MRIFFSVGEPSGDLHGSNLIRHLTSHPMCLRDALPPEATGDWSASADAAKRSADDSLIEPIECVGFGGPKMAEAGCELLFDLTTMAVMFFSQAIRNLRFFFRLVDQADEYFKNHQVDAVVLIDYPGFNWWIAKKAKQHGIPVYYYGVPQMWAWAPWRIRKIRKYVDHVLCKLPFEVNWFKQRNCQATYVGHPYFDQVHSYEMDQGYLEQLNGGEQAAKQLVTLLPGSRNQEVRTVLPVLLKSAEKVQQQTDCRLMIASFNQPQAEMAREILTAYRDANPRSTIQPEIVVDRTPELMQAADVCLACSGSVSMELLHYRTPTIIVFKIKRWMMFAQSILLKAKFITLVNLIATDDIRKRTWRPFDPDAKGAEDAVMPEYLTTGDPAEQVARRAVTWLSDEEARQANIARLDALAKKYALAGATGRAAEYLMQQLGLVPVNRQVALSGADRATEVRRPA